MYSVFKSAEDSVIDCIDCIDLDKKIKLFLNYNDIDMHVKLKKLLKSKKKFKEFSKNICIPESELIYLLVKLYPEIFNHRLIKFIRKVYLNYEE